MWYGFNNVQSTCNKREGWQLSVGQRCFVVIIWTYYIVLALLAERFQILDLTFPFFFISNSQNRAFLLLLVVTLCSKWSFCWLITGKICLLTFDFFLFCEFINTPADQEPNPSKNKVIWVLLYCICRTIFCHIIVKFWIKELVPHSVAKKWIYSFN